MNEDVIAVRAAEARACAGDDRSTIAKLERAKPQRLLFTPHLIPMTRGILATCYAKGKATTEQCLEAARKFYADRPFVRVTDKPPHTKWATGSNLVFVSYAADPDAEPGDRAGRDRQPRQRRRRAGGAERESDHGPGCDGGIDGRFGVAVNRLREFEIGRRREDISAT